MRKVLIILGIVGVVAAASAVVIIKVWNPGVNKARSSPIIFVHGLGGSANVWQQYGIIDYFKTDLSLGFGGIIQPDVNSSNVLHDQSLPEVNGNDFFAINFPDNQGHIDDQAKQLRNSILYILNLTGANRVTIIGFSMGGVTSRAYLSLFPNDHKVDHLLTIGSPHLGSKLAYISIFKSYMTSYQSENPISGMVFSPVLGEIEALENEIGFQFDSYAVAELLPPEKGNYLYNLNKKPLPKDVRYSVLIGNVHPDNGGVQGITENVWSSLEELANGNFGLTESKALVLNLFQANFFQGAGETILSGGDGVVSTASQNLNRIAQFKNDPELNARIFEADDVHHLRECWKHQQIKVILQ